MARRLLFEQGNRNFRQAMDRPLKETVYTPDSELLSFGKLLRSMWADLLASREVFIFGTTTDVTAVIEIDGQPVGDGKPGPVQQKLSSLLLAEQRTDTEHTESAFA